MKSNGNGSSPTVRVLRQALAVASHTELVCLIRRQLELLGEKQNSKTITSALLGSFRDDGKMRSEFLRLAYQHG